MLKGRAVLCFTLVILALLAGAVSANSDWMTRPGTVGHALMQSDGSQISLDAIVVDKIHVRQTPVYFTVRECFD